jgi:hypothetical protein
MLVRLQALEQQMESARIEESVAVIDSIFVCPSLLVPLRPVLVSPTWLLAVPQLRWKSSIHWP